MSGWAYAHSTSTSRWAILSLVVTGHAGLLAIFLGTLSHDATPPVFVASAVVKSEAVVELSAPSLTNKLLTIPIAVRLSLAMPQIDAAASETDAQNSAPVLASVVPEEMRLALAQRAGLHAQEQVTVLLRIEILATGQVGEVVVERSGGTPAMDAAAMDYVRMLHWIAGRRGGEPAACIIRWGVRLGV